MYLHAGTIFVKFFLQLICVRAGLTFCCPWRLFASAALKPKVDI
jgi:hypothetical protein